MTSELERLILKALKGEAETNEEVVQEVQNRKGSYKYSTISRKLREMYRKSDRVEKTERGRYRIAKNPEGIKPLTEFCGGDEKS